MSKKRTLKKSITFFTVFFLLLLGIACIFYVKDYYHSQSTVKNFLKSDNIVAVTEEKDFISFTNKIKTSENAFIFYQGAKVESTAYAPLLYQLAENGIDCFLVKMPFHLAVLSPNKANTVLKDYEDQYTNWYIGGHSLGGAIAASYASKNVSRLKGLILLGAYSTNDLSDTDLFVLSIYGSNDHVLNHEKYENYKKNLPTSFSELVLEGGNHAYYGNYGEQKGDGKADLTRQEQQEKTCDAIIKWIAP